MPLVVDGVEIPVSALTDDASFQHVKKELDSLEKDIDGFIAQNKKRRVTVEETAKAEVKAAQAAKKAQDDYRASLNRTREDAEKLQQVSTMALMGGTAIVAPMILAAKKFADTARESDSVARQWKDSFASLESSSLKAGRVIADQLNPALKETAKIMATVVGYLEKNPNLAGAALAVGGGLISLGAIGTVVATIEKTVATLALLTGAGAPVAGAAAGAGAGGVGAVVAAAAPYVVPALLAAGAVAMIVASVKDQKENGSFNMAAAQANGYLPKGYTAPSAGIQTSVQENYNKALSEELKIKNLLWMETVRASAGAREEELVAARQNKAGIQAKMYALEQETYQKQVEIITKFANQRNAVMASLEAENAKAYTDYQDNRSKMVRDAEIEIKRIRSDSQKRLQQMEKDHGQKTYELLAARDALGLTKENKRYEDEKKLEQDATREEIARRRADLKLKLSDLAKSYNQEMHLRADAANAKLQILADEQAAELQMMAAQQGAIYSMLIAAFQAAIAQIGTLGGNSPVPVTGAKAAGGYAGKGVYKMGEMGREFVLDAATTRAMERNVGGSLNQSNVLGSGMTVNINLGTGGTISQFRQMVNTAKSEIVREFGKALEAA